MLAIKWLFYFIVERVEDFLPLLKQLWFVNLVLFADLVSRLARGLPTRIQKLITRRIEHEQPEV